MISKKAAWETQAAFFCKKGKSNKNKIAGMTEIE